MTEQEEFYVGIENPDDIRRQILETSRDVVVSLQRFEKFKITMLKRLDYIEKVKSNVKEINDLILRLKKVLPASRIRIKPIVEKEVIKKASGSKGDDLERLEKELSEIESRLRTLKR